MKYEVHKCVCTECGQEMYVPRKKKRQREVGHIKDLYCIKCGRITKFREMRDWE